MFAHPGPSLGSAIRAFRQRAGLTIEELAEASGISPRAVSDIERGLRQSPHRKTIVALSHGLQLRADESAELEEAFRSTRANPPRERHSTLPLPRISAEFIGRSSQLTQLHDALVAEREGAVAVVTGAPGIGKTSLAVNFARTVEAGFQRILFIDLGGAGDTPLSTVEVAQRLVGGLHPAGVLSNGEQVFTQLQDALRDHKILLVLDNVASEAQVRPLLPTHGPSTALLTSRLRLAGLVGVTHVALPPLMPSESTSFLSEVLPTDTYEEAALQDLAHLCSHVPLALRIAANQVNAFPERTVAHVVARLESTEQRLGTLTAGDLSLESACRSSYEQLDATTQHVFRRLGIAESATVSVAIASQLTELSEGETRSALDRLSELSLIDPSGVDRYTAHELLWLFAKNCLEEAEDPASLQRVRAHADRRIIESVALAGRFFTGDLTYIVSDWFRAPLFRGGSSEEAAVWLLEERPDWQGALYRVAARNEYLHFRAALYHLHWFSKVWHYESPWAELFTLGGHSAAKLGHYGDSCMFYGELIWFLLVNKVGLEQAESAEQLMNEAAARTDDSSALAWASYYRGKLRIEQDLPEAALAEARVAAYGEQSVVEPAVGVIARQLLAEILMRIGSVDEALDVLREMNELLLEREADIPDIGVTLSQANMARLIAQTNHQTGDWAATIAASTQALSKLEGFAFLPIHPLMAVILSSRAFAYEQRGCTAQANADRVRVRELAELH